MRPVLMWGCFVFAFVTAFQPLLGSVLESLPGGGLMGVMQYPDYAREGFRFREVSHQQWQVMIIGMALLWLMTGVGFRTSIARGRWPFLVVVVWMVIDDVNNASVPVMAVRNEPDMMGLVVFLVAAGLMFLPRRVKDRLSEFVDGQTPRT